MSWFPSSNFASLAKNALKEAQKTIDKALDIKDENGGESINSTVASMADAATDFFTSWGVSGGSKPAPSATAEDELTVEQLEPPVVTTAPAPSIPTFDPSPTNSVPNGMTVDPEEDVTVEMQRSQTATDVSCELVGVEGPLLHFTSSETTTNFSKGADPEEKFQSLWLDGSMDSFESSSTSTTTIDVSSDSCYLAKEKDTQILHPKPLHSQQKALLAVLAITNGEESPLLIMSPTLPNSETVSVSPPPPSPSPAQPETETATMLNVEAPDMDPVSVTAMQELEPVSFSDEPGMMTIESSEGDLDSSTATTVEFVPDVDGSPSMSNPELLDQLNSPEILECQIEDPISSKVSTSSRATSSISVISEGKDPSSPQISPTSQQNLTGSSVDSPSFEVISIHHLQQHTSRKEDSSSSSFDFLGSSSSQQCPSLGSSVCVIPSLQSTPERGTPLTHSRSNSNTSSSFDRVEEYNNRLPKCPHHFLSSTSSSDIEIIDSHGLENLHRKRRSLAEVETQTVDVWPLEKADKKEKGVEMIPAKTSALLAEKDFEIAELREEGGKLSKKQFELSTAIKKLRVKEKETDATVKNLKGDLVTKNVEMERLVKTLLAKETQEQGQSETIGKLNAENRKLLNTVSQLRSELEDAKENTASMKASLEDASVEMLELQNTISSVQRDTAELDALTRLNGELKNRSDSLQKEIDNLRESMKIAQQKSTARETELEAKVHVLTSKVHHLENQLGENISEVADATMPLSLEIEKLQQELKEKTSGFERREFSLCNKVAELEVKVKAQGEVEKSLKSSQLVLEDTVSSLELVNEQLVNEKSAMEAQLAAGNALRLEHLKKLENVSSMEAKIQELASQLSSLGTENNGLRLELKNERNTVQAEVKRGQMLSEQLKLTQAERVSFSSTSGGGYKAEESRDTSPRSVLSEASYLDDVLEPGGQNPTCLTPKSFFDSSSVSYIENLQGHLRQRELELVTLQQEVSKNEKIRKSLNEEIAILTVNNQEIIQRLERQAGLQQRLAEVEKNYNAVLQMYGEKVEEADELRMDLQDVKEMYKLQIEQLLKKTSAT